MISNVFREDIEQIVSSGEISWDALKNAVILVTGATGLIGNALVYVLSAANDTHKLGLRTIAHGRNTAKGKVLSQECKLEFVCSDIRKTPPTSLIVDEVGYIFHCASVTRSADMMSKPVDVITTAVDGTRNTLELARKKRSKSVVFLSSMEVYGQTVSAEVAESDLGYLDILTPRSSYPESKRLCENLCVGYHKQWGLPVKIARLAQTFGAGTPMDDTRVFAQFARSAITEEGIVLHTDGKSRGNYCYTADVVRALLLLLLKGEDGQAYNVANPGASMTIREMAELVAGDICHGKIHVKTEIPLDAAKLGYAPDSGHRLNIDKIKKLGWKPKYDLAEMYRRLLSDWQDTMFKN